MAMDFSKFHKGELVRFEYKVPDNAPGCSGPSGTVIMKIQDITMEIVWGYQTPESPLYRGNVRFYKKYIHKMERYKIP